MESVSTIAWILFSLSSEHFSSLPIYRWQTWFFIQSKHISTGRSEAKICVSKVEWNEMSALNIPLCRKIIFLPNKSLLSASALDRRILKDAAPWHLLLFILGNRLKHEFHPSMALFSRLSTDSVDSPLIRSAYGAALAMPCIHIFPRTLFTQSFAGSSPFKTYPDHLDHHCSPASSFINLVFRVTIHLFFSNKQLLMETFSGSSFVSPGS